MRVLNKNYTCCLTVVCLYQQIKLQFTYIFVQIQFKISASKRLFAKFEQIPSKDYWGIAFTRNGQTYNLQTYTCLRPWAIVHVRQWMYIYHRLFYLVHNNCVSMYLYIYDKSAYKCEIPPLKNNKFLNLTEFVAADFKSIAFFLVQILGQGVSP